MTVEEFKACFKSYVNFVKEEKKIEDKIEELYYELSGVKGIRYDKIPSSFNKELANERQLLLIELINTKQAELKYKRAQFEYFELLMSKFTKEEIVLLYRLLIKEQTYDSVGLDLGYSASGFWKYVERLIGSVI